MPKTKEDVEIRIKEQSKQGKDYSVTIKLNDVGEAIHQTSKIQGTLKYFLFQTDSENELDIHICPIDFERFLLHIKHFKRFGVYPWKIPAVGNEGEAIEAPPEWTDVYFNDKLRVRVSGGQPNSTIRMVIRYVQE